MVCLYDNWGNPLVTGIPYTDSERGLHSNGETTAFCEVTSIGIDYFELGYADGTTKTFNSPESLFTRAKELVPIRKNELRTRLSNLKTQESWIEKYLHKTE